MSFHGPIVIVADAPSPGLAAAIRAAGGSPVEAAWAEAPQKILTAWPAAVVINAVAGGIDKGTIAAIERSLATMREPYLPVLARVARKEVLPIEGALPVAANAGDERVVARLTSALRVRSLHAAAFRRSATLAAAGGNIPALPDSDPLTDATVMVAGRGRSYPELTTAVGERLGLIGAMSIETAARYLTARPLDGILIGDGFSPVMIDAFVTAVGTDDRFRDLPVALINGTPIRIDLAALPNFEQFDGAPFEVVEWMLPLVRLHAYEGRLQRQLKAIEAKGMLDPLTGLFTAAAFRQDLKRAVAEARARKLAMSLARYSFLPFVGQRAALDAARLVSGMVRSVDFASQSPDGSILMCFPNTALQSSHVVARRIASSLKGTMLAADKMPGHNDPIVTLAALKPADTAESLLARVSEPVKVAAE